MLEWRDAELDPAIVVFSLVFVAILTAIAVIDWRSTRIPNALVLPLLLLGGAMVFTREPSLRLDHWFGFLAGAAVFLLIQLGHRAVRRVEGLGTGDVKLFAVIGLWVTWKALPLVLVIASLTALVAAIARGWSAGTLRLQDRIPFGPFLGIGGAVAWFAGDLLQ